MSFAPRMQKPPEKLYVIWSPRMRYVVGIARDLAHARSIDRKHGGNKRISHVNRIDFLKAIYAGSCMPLLGLAPEKEEEDLAY